MPALDPAWSAYTPDDAAPWDLRRVAHLHRRAGFAGTWAELRRDLKDGPGPSIDRLLAGKSALHAPGEFAPTADLLADAAVAAMLTAALPFEAGSKEYYRLLDQIRGDRGGP